jgi:hypothetical protein
MARGVYGVWQRHTLLMGVWGLSRGKEEDEEDEEAEKKTKKNQRGTRRQMRVDGGRPVPRFCFWGGGGVVLMEGFSWTCLV